MVAASGWLGGLAVLSALHGWAFQTKLRTWAMLTGIYTALLMIVIAEWIDTSRGILDCLGRFVLAATLLPITMSLFTGGWSLVLLISGFAYIIAAIAALAFFAVGMQRK